MSEEQKINNCHCCGSDAVGIESRNVALFGTKIVFYIDCAQCGARGPELATPEQAIEAWNATGERLARVNTLENQLICAVHGRHELGRLLHDILLVYSELQQTDDPITAHKYRQELWTILDASREILKAVGE